MENFTPISAFSGGLLIGLAATLLLLFNGRIAIISGLLFGIGLTLSKMTNLDKVINFLDLAGNWDPSLIFVMLGALSVTLLSFRQILKFQRPLFDKEFYLPSKTAIDKPLLIGAAIFGMGWGISGYCPGFYCGLV
jgi:uncharacterized protein